MRGLVFAIVTFGFGTIMWVIASNWVKLTRGTRGIISIPPPEIGGFKLQTEVTYYYFVLGLLLVVIYLLHSMWHSKFGRAIITARENEPLARASGINTSLYFILAFGLATALAGVSGAAYAHFIGIVTPDLLGIYYMFIMLIMIFAGGIGTTTGPIVGAVIFVFVPELLRVTAEFRFVIFGAILLIVVVFLRRGLYPSLIALWEKHVKAGAR
jgi:branched-chain amino acid transport system permease protein